MNATSNEIETAVESIAARAQEGAHTASDISQRAEKLHKSFAVISSATNEGAEGTANIAEKTTDVVNKSNEIVAQAGKSQQSADKLINLVSKFQV